MRKDKSRTKQAKEKIFEQIEVLLDKNDLEYITFARIAEMCGCRPNSISYYFKNKMDMLLQFTQYFLEKDSLYQSSLSFTPSDLDPVKGFCSEIDKIFSASEKKSRVRLLSNYFLITNAALSMTFKKYLDEEVHKEVDAYRHMLSHYHSLGILCEERLHNSFTELCFWANALSVLYIFQIPIWDYSVQLHNVKEHLKSSFLKDHLYSETPLDFSLPLSELKVLEKRYAKDALAPAFPVSELQEAVFEHIARLLREDRKDDITFSYLAKHCYCQTSSIAYYFENKTDMLLQFTKYHLHKFYSKSTEYTYTPPEGLSDEEAFDKFILDVVEGSYKRSKVVYWINYLVICNAPANQEFYHYLKLSLLRKLHRYQTIVHYYTQKGILKEEKLYQLFHELCFLGDSIALTNIFQIPITDKSYFETFTHDRLLSAFLKPEYYQKLKEEATD